MQVVQAFTHPAAQVVPQLDVQSLPHPLHPEQPVQVELHPPEQPPEHPLHPLEQLPRHSPVQAPRQLDVLPVIVSAETEAISSLTFSTHCGSIAVPPTTFSSPEMSSISSARSMVFAPKSAVTCAPAAGAAVKS